MTPPPLVALTLSGSTADYAIEPRRPGRESEYLDAPWPCLYAAGVGMYGQWLRVTPAELDRAKADLQWAQDHAERVEEAEYPLEQDLQLSPRDIAERRSMSTEKTWHALDFLLTRRGFPVSIIMGEHPFGDDVDSLEDPDTDWGYGPPSYLTPDEVRRAAEALAGLSEEDLLDGVDPGDLTRAEIYPNVWDRGPSELQWAVCELPWVKAYFEAAAKDGDAILCWIN
jgi:hypothetical protein